MKRSTARWTTAVAAAALLAMPVGSWAQQTTPSTTPRQQAPGAPSSQPSGRPAGAESQQGSANEHLRQAQSALADIPAASLTGTAKTRVAELKRHLNMLEQSAAQGATARRGSATASRATWSTEVASVDRILTELLGADSATSATAPSPAGTSGSTASAPKTTTGSKAATSMTLDDSARAKLQEVRTHVTAFAAAMSGTSATPSSDDPSTSASASAPASATATTGAAGATATAGTTGTAAAPSQPAATPATPADPAAPTSPAQAAAETPSPAPAQQVDADTVKRHLTAARDTLSQLTQLPAAAQLTGDARTQVSQLISNFNELITTNTDWRASYTKVQANLTALVGEQRADESPAPAAGTAGAVGTSGTTALDPGIRAKLVELRSHLMEFEKAAGGGAPKASTPAAPPSDTTAAAASPAAPASPDAAAAPSAPASATAPATPSASATPAPTGTSGRTADPAATAGTSGKSTVPAEGEDQTAKPATGERQTGKPTTPAADMQKAAEGHSAAMSHIEAIEAILNGTSAPAGSTAGTTGTAGKTAKPSTLDSAQIEQIRTHLQQLRRELSKSGGR
jgi:hypothetical protein